MNPEKFILSSEHLDSTLGQPSADRRCSIGGAYTAEISPARISIAWPESGEKEGPRSGGVSTDAFRNLKSRAPRP